MFRRAIFAGVVGKPDLPEALFEGAMGEQRRRMVYQHLRGRDVRDARVLEVMARVRREEFVGAGQQGEAYEDKPLDIGDGQTISQPYIVARMSELLEVTPGTRVLEIGCGCGYQTAVLMELGAFVFGVELRQRLVDEAAARLTRLGYTQFQIVCGNGFAGYAEQAPYDAIVGAAAPPELPLTLVEQLARGGRMVIPAGPMQDQHLLRVRRGEDGTIGTERLFPVRFVPMTDDAAEENCGGGE